MGVGALSNFLRRHRRIALDTSVFIDQLEANARYSELTDQVFTWLDQPGNSAVTSTITMSELLVFPYRLSDAQQVDTLYALLRTYPNLDWIAPDLAIADRAAQIRAEHRLRRPDALQAATAVHSGASGLVTNDAVFERVSEFETLVLDHLVRSGP